MDPRLAVRDFIPLCGPSRKDVRLLVATEDVDGHVQDDGLVAGVCHHHPAHILDGKDLARLAILRKTLTLNFLRDLK